MMDRSTPTETETLMWRLDLINEPEILGYAVGFSDNTGYVQDFNFNLNVKDRNQDKIAFRTLVKPSQKTKLDTFVFDYETASLIAYILQWHSLFNDRKCILFYALNSFDTGHDKLILTPVEVCEYQP